MEDLSELYRELERHREEMFFTIERTLKDATAMFDDELLKILKAAVEIYDNKYQTLKKNNSVENEDRLFESILDKFLQNYESNFFSFSWVKSYSQIKSCISPLTDDDAYRDFILSVPCISEITLTFGEQLFFLAGAFRFYSKLGTTPPPNFSISIDIPTILRIDREVAFIREEVYSAIATRKNAATTAKRITGTNISNASKKSDNCKKCQETFANIAKEKTGRRLSFNQFCENAAPRLETSPTSVRNYLESFGVTKETFDEWFSSLKQQNLT